MMREAIEKFAGQFSFNPEIQNKKALARCKRFVVLGMGGSALAAELVKAWNPALPIIIHRSYGLPAMLPSDAKETLVIACSYSGNTEEVVDGYEAAKKAQLPIAVIAVGGKLLELAQKDGVPCIVLPNLYVQPRMALGLSLKALCTMIGGMSQALDELSELWNILKPVKFEHGGKNLATTLKGFVPVVYASSRNYAIAYNWKIKFNETGKIPAFMNVIPEANHNEMTGFDVQKRSAQLSHKFSFIILTDTEDHPRVQKRMKILEKLYRARHLPVIVVPLKGHARFEKICSSLLLADWAAYYTAKLYGLESEQVPMVEEFKKLMK